MTDPDREAEKAAAATAAVAEIAAGMLVGLGSGTTAAYAVDALGRRVRGGLRIRATATSLATARAAEAAGIAILDFADLAAVDLCIDGVDTIDPAFRAIKGGGGAHVRERIVAAAATRMIAIADSTKPVAALTGPVPVEILPFARASAFARIEALGGRPVLREGRLSDQGNLLVDCAFETLDVKRVAAGLAAIPGLVGHGLFLDEIDVLIVGTADGVERRTRP